MFDLAFDTTTFDYGLGFDSYDSFTSGLIAPTHMSDVFSDMNTDLDVSGFTLRDWKQFDPLNLDIRNPYIGGYPSFGEGWDPMLDYDPNADIMSAGMFPNMPSPEMANALGLISDQDLAFLDMLGPSHNNETIDFHHIDSEPSIEQQKLDQSNWIERERDAAVEKYNDAKRVGDYEEMLKWETIANDRQQDLYYLWDTPQYGLPAKAPGIN